MTVSNGNLANQTTFNNAFLSKTASTSNTVAKIGLLNAASESGTGVTNAQRELNAIMSFLGGVLNQVKTYLPTWTTNYFGSSTDSVFTRIDAIDGALDFRSDTIAIGNGDDGVTGSFSSALVDDNYSITFNVSNEVDSTPIFLQGYAQSYDASGFIIRFNAATDSSNYVLHYRAMRDR